MLRFCVVVARLCYGDGVNQAVDRTSSVQANTIVYDCYSLNFVTIMFGSTHIQHDLRHDNLLLTIEEEDLS